MRSLARRHAASISRGVLHGLRAARGPESAEDEARRRGVHTLTRYALRGLWQSVAGGRALCDEATVESFLAFAGLDQTESDALLARLRGGMRGAGVAAAAWESLADALLAAPEDDGY